MRAIGMCGHTSMPLAQHTRTPIHADPLVASCTFGQAQLGHGYGAAVNAGPLAELDDRMLRDIGVTRSQSQHEAAKPFWSAGKA